MKVSGTFDVHLKSLDPHAQGEHGIIFRRMSISKRYMGELSGSSKGEMLSVNTAVKGSAGYTAMEQVEGTLCGKWGSFVLQHFGQNNKGNSHLILKVVPDSATGKLVGLVGEMRIRVEGGQHFYEFEFGWGEQE